MNILDIFKKKKDNELVGAIQIALIRGNTRLKPIEFRAIKSNGKLQFSLSPFAMDDTGNNYSEYFSLVMLLCNLKPAEAADAIAESLAYDKPIDTLHKHINFSTGLESGYKISSSTDDVISGLIVSKRIAKEMLGQL